MAERALFTVTEEERRIARELSEENYQTYIALERAEAREEGLSEGEALGARQKALQDAGNLKHLGVTIDIIVQATGLSKHEVENI